MERKYFEFFIKPTINQERINSRSRNFNSNKKLLRHSYLYLKEERAVCPILICDRRRSISFSGTP